MRIILSLVLVVLFPCSGLFAQNGYSYGFRIGIHMADIQVEDDEFSDSYGNRFGPAVGAFVSIPLNESISVRPELWYLRKGAEASFDLFFFGEDLSFESTFQFDYVEVPILISYTPRTGGKALPNLFAGPSVGSLTSAKYKIEAAGESESASIKSNLKSTDISLIFGGGLDFGLGSRSLVVDIRYMLGLSNILKSPIEDDFDEFDNSNSDGSIKNKGKCSKNGTSPGAGLTFTSRTGLNSTVVQR
ncbi:MAG: PorT family protein [Rhodothermaceae bacterium]|nr:PorT family protein [Rhodothermaceae bacterium]